MRRYPAFDPPEYIDWQADPDLVREYARRVEEDEARAQVCSELGRPTLLALYEGMLRNRLHDIALKRWVRTGVISKAWLGTGEEATTIGAVHALDRRRDVVGPMIRNAGACHEMGMPLDRLFSSYLGTTLSPAGGRDLHVGDLEWGVLAPISHVGDLVPVLTGVAMSFAQRGEDRVALTWIGDGATKTAAFHEGMNLAAVRGAPLIVIIQNNQVALGTRLAQHGAGPLAAWPRMYGVAGGVLDGNNVLDVYAGIRLAAERARSGGGPSLLIAETFRMGGHATHDEREARETFSPELFQHWGRRDPIGLYEAYLFGRGFDAAELEALEARVAEQVEAAAERALASRDAMPAPQSAEWPGISAGVRQPGLAARLDA